MQLKTLLIISIAITSLAVSASGKKIYKLVKSDGTVIFTDKPPAEGSEYKLVKQLNVMPSMATKQNSKTTKVPQSSASKTTLILLEPAHEATVRNNAGRVAIKASLSPEGNGEFVLYLNGQAHARHTAPMFTLDGLDRGTYHIKMEYLDQSGKLLASTQQSTFYLHKASALIQAN